MGSPMKKVTYSFIFALFLAPLFASAHGIVHFDIQKFLGTECSGDCHRHVTQWTGELVTPKKVNRILFYARRDFRTQGRLNFYLDNQLIARNVSVDPTWAGGHYVYHEIMIPPQWANRITVIPLNRDEIYIHHIELSLTPPAHQPPRGHFELVRVMNFDGKCIGGEKCGTNETLEIDLPEAPLKIHWIEFYARGTANNQSALSLKVNGTPIFAEIPIRSAEKKYRFKTPGVIGGHITFSPLHGHEVTIDSVKVGLTRQ